MKKLLALLFFILIAIWNCSAKASHVDSLKQQLNRTQADSTKFNVLMALTQYYQDSKQDSLLFYAKQELRLAYTSNNTNWIATAYGNVGVYEYITGNYPVALQMLFKSLQLAESIKDSSLMEYIFEKIGNTYKEYDAPDKAKQYYLQIKILAEKQHNEQYLFFANTNLGYVYTLLNVLDSAMILEQEALEFAKRSHSEETGWVLLYLGDVQLKCHHKSLALDCFKQAIELNTEIYGNSRVLSKSYLALADFYNQYGLKDSAIYYAYKAMYVAKIVPYQKGISIASRFLSSLFDSLHQPDSSFYYLKIFVLTNDSLYDRNRTSSVETLTFLEQLRQQEIEQAYEKAKKERKQNIGYALIALGIVTFIILFLLLIRSVVIHEKLIEVLGVIALLIVFEFLNLLLHPFFSRVTNENPLLMLLSLVCIAALLVPLHHRLEKWATHRLVEKNKQIRLAAAKKTIEKLENKKPEA